MHTTDEWGLDPEVLKLRTYFSKMESNDGELIQHLKISLFDQRLRPARKLRLKLFQNSCHLALKKGIHLDETTGLKIFIICQDLAFKKYGLLTTESAISENPELLALVMENFK